MSAFNTQVFNKFPITQVIDHHISVQVAADFTGYNIQYLRRLLRAGKLSGTKIGQVWLIKLSSLESYFQERESSSDQRCGPKNTVTGEMYSIVNTPCLQTYTEKVQEK
jgi:excisionase family DNA binding protein